MVAERASHPEPLSLHRCKICGTRWLLWPAGVGGTTDASWNLLDKYQRPASCCDNASMIEHLRDLSLEAARTPQPAAPAQPPAVTERERLAIEDRNHAMQRQVALECRVAELEAALEAAHPPAVEALIAEMRDVVASNSFLMSPTIVQRWADELEAALRAAGSAPK